MVNNNALVIIISTVEIKNFRLFSQKQCEFYTPITIVEGENGSGKTSLIEALYFLGNVRSCKTAFVDHIIKKDEISFFLKAVTHSTDSIYMGVQHKKKVVKINQKPIHSIQQVRDILITLHLLDTDLFIIQGGPLERRTYLDNALMLLEPSAIDLLRKLTYAVKQRNELLHSLTFNHTLYQILTEQLTHISCDIQMKRKELIARINLCIDHYKVQMNLPVSSIVLVYQPKKDCTIDQKEYAFASIEHIEKRYKKSMYGAHLDEIVILWNGLNSRTYCSRGQQKLIVFLLKLSIVHLLNHEQKQVFLLIDDFMTDLDERIMHMLVQTLCGLNIQLLCTSPIKGVLQKAFAPYASLVQTIQL